MKPVDFAHLAGSSAALAGSAERSPQATTNAFAWHREMERAQADAWFLGALPTPERQAQASSTPRRAQAPGTNEPSTAGRRAFDGNRRSMALAHGPATTPHSARPASEWPTSAGPSSSAAHELAGGSSESSMAAVSAAETGETPNGPHPHAEGRSVAPARAQQTFAWALASETPSPLPDAEVLADELMAQAQRSARHPPGSTGSDTPSQVRVHIEGAPQQPTVWLGVDATAVAELPALTEAISRWLARAGYGTPSFVCNGKALAGPVNSGPSARQPTSRMGKGASPSSTHESMSLTNPGEPA